MTNSPEHRIFHVPEMLEAILSELPLKDLLLDQAVCTTWMNAIKRSSKLQKKLFLEPNGDVWSDLYERNRLRQKGLPTPDFTFNPLLKKHTEALVAGSTFRKENGTLVVDQAVLDNDASWTKMLLTQPPLEQHYIAAMWSSDHHPRRDVITLARILKGITMLDVILAMKAGFQSIKKAPFERFTGCQVPRDALWINWLELPSSWMYKMLANEDVVVGVEDESKQGKEGPV